MADISEIAVPREVKPAKKGSILGLVFVSHAMNHVHSGVLNVFYPIFREEFGIGYTGIGFLATVNQLVSSVLQVTYGFLARFIGRGVLLGVGNMIIAMAAIGMGFSMGYAQLVTWAAVKSAGSSAQHPVGAATLATYYEKKRAQVLGLHQSVGNIGGWIAPLLAAFLLMFTGWRQIVWIIAIPSFLMGLAYFGFRELMVPAAGGVAVGKKQGRARLGLADYGIALKNRNIMFLTMAMLAGAAGRGTNMLSTYLTTYLVDTYKMDVARAGFFFSAMTLGGVVGPLAVGWLADRTSHKFVALSTIFAAAVLNFTIIFYPAASWLLLSHVVLAGIFMWARGPMIETLFTEATDKATLDTLLSIYYAVAFVSGPIWTMLTGLVIDRFGFTWAFGVIAGSYLLGMIPLAFVNFGAAAKRT
ncbi:MAG: MFS transporter [Chloroflexi bacterium]|nr:MFS transporter [Chloroflexota bacterium]